MLRFYFDLHDNANCSPDIYGDDFSSFEDARQQAQAILADLMREEMPDGESRLFTCEIRDEQHDVLYRCTLSMHGERLQKSAQTAPGS